MLEIRVVLTNKAGLHARPAGALVRTAAKFNSRITVATDEGKTADGKSILGVLALGAREGAAVTIRIEGDDEEEAAAALQSFFAEQGRD